MDRWKIVDRVFCIDGVEVFSANFPVIYGSFTQERLLLLLNAITVKG